MNKINGWHNFGIKCLYCDMAPNFTRKKRQLKTDEEKDKFFEIHKETQNILDWYIRSNKHINGTMTRLLDKNAIKVNKETWKHSFYLINPKLTIAECLDLIVQLENKTYNVFCYNKWSKKFDHIGYDEDEFEEYENELVESLDNEILIYHAINKMV